MAETKRDRFNLLLKYVNYIESSACLGRINNWYSLSYMYFIILEGEHVPTHKVGRPDGGVLNWHAIFKNPPTSPYLRLNPRLSIMATYPFSPFSNLCLAIHLPSEETTALICECLLQLWSTRYGWSQVFTYETLLKVIMKLELGER